MKATWNGKVIAETSDANIISIEGNSYFPPDSIKSEYFVKSDYHTTCPWKGLAYYYDITVEGKTNENSAWYYPEPKAGSIERVGSDFISYVAFWKGVEIA